MLGQLAQEPHLALKVLDQGVPWVWSRGTTCRASLWAVLWLVPFRRRRYVPGEYHAPLAINLVGLQAAAPESLAQGDARDPKTVRGISHG